MAAVSAMLFNGAIETMAIVTTGFQRRTIRLRWLFVILTVFFTGLFAVGETTAAGDDGLPAFQGEITLLDMCIPDPDSPEAVNASYEAFNRLLSQWQAAHPEVSVKEKKIRRYADISSLTVIDALPDIFFLDSVSTRRYAEDGLIADLEEILQEDPDRSGYDPVLTEPYRVQDKLYALPAFTRNEMIVVYDRKAFEERGADAFPADWEACRQLSESFREEGSSGLFAYSAAGNGINIIRDILSPLAADQAGTGWLTSMRNREDAMCTDPTWTSKLQSLRVLLDDGVLDPDCLEMDTKAAQKAFAKGEYPAVWLPLNEAFELLDDLKDQNPDLYSRLDFTRLPLPAEEITGKNRQCAWMTYGMVIRKDDMDDPDRLRACLDLCCYLTGGDYAAIMEEEYGLPCGWQSDPAGRSAESKDETMARLISCIHAEVELAPVLTQYLDPLVWYACSAFFKDLISVPDTSGDTRTELSGEHASAAGDMGNAADDTEEATNEEIACKMQDAYERYYMNGIGFSVIADLMG